MENDNIFDTLTHKGLEALGRYYSTYRAIVVDNEDSDNLNRLSVVIPQISPHPVLAYPKGMDGSMQSGFKWLKPRKGQIVWIEFQMGDFLFPLWQYHGWGKGECPAELSDPDTLGMVTPSGHVLTIQDKKGILNLNITDPDNEEKVSTSLIIEKGKLGLTCEDEITVKAKKINLMSGNVGLTKTDELLKKMNALEDSLNNLKVALGPNNPLITALVPAWASVTEWTAKAIVKTTMDNIENKDILQ